MTSGKHLQIDVIYTSCFHRWGFIRGSFNIITSRLLDYHLLGIFLPILFWFITEKHLVKFVRDAHMQRKHNSCSRGSAQYVCTHLMMEKLSIQHNDPLRERLALPFLITTVPWRLWPLTVLISAKYRGLIHNKRRGQKTSRGRKTNSSGRRMHG